MYCPRFSTGGRWYLHYRTPYSTINQRWHRCILLHVLNKKKSRLQAFVKPKIRCWNFPRISTDKKSQSWTGCQAPYAANTKAQHHRWRTAQSSSFNSYDDMAGLLGLTASNSWNNKKTQNITFRNLSESKNVVFGLSEKAPRKVVTNWLSGQAPMLCSWRASRCPSRFRLDDTWLARLWSTWLAWFRSRLR